MEIFAVIVHNLLSLTIFLKSSIMGVRLGYEYASVDIKQLLTFSKKKKMKQLTYSLIKLLLAPL